MKCHWTFLIRVARGRNGNDRWKNSRMGWTDLFVGIRLELFQQWKDYSNTFSHLCINLLVSFCGFQRWKLEDEGRNFMVFNLSLLIKIVYNWTQNWRFYLSNFSCWILLTQDLVQSSKTTPHCGIKLIFYVVVGPNSNQ